ncbi:MAG TPA: hypothetical protein PKE47_08085 [Verrucomicrobiota bacterium]|nr:hypothetical protein [Verrucomicrobiota bacterium]
MPAVAASAGEPLPWASRPPSVRHSRHRGERRASLAVPLIRLLERALPLPVLLGLCGPVAWLRAAVFRLAKGRPRPLPRPDWLGCPRAFRPARLPVYLDRVLEALPDRLALPAWRRRCRFDGLEHLHAATRSGRGAVLAFLHFGPVELLGPWLRAAGEPASLLVRFEPHGRPRQKCTKDALARFPGVPPVFQRDELAAAVRHLAAGRPLGVALDATAGRQLRLQHPSGWDGPLATGAIRLACRHGVPLLACAITRTGAWRYAVEVSPPVPPEAWAGGEEAIARCLLDFLLPLLRRHPEQCHPSLLGVKPPAPRAAA